MNVHIVQSSEWADFKNEYGTPAVTAGGVTYTKHKIPLTSFYYAYCPKVNPFKINFSDLKKSLKKNKCFSINFDVPNVIVGSDEEAEAVKIFEKTCVRAKRSEFAKENIILDISKSEEELFNQMYKKHRYNVRYAQKHGVKVKEASEEKDFDIFFNLFKATADRQKFYIRDRRYYKLIWEKFHSRGMCTILTAYYEKTPLVSWMVFVKDGVLYYPYGGSSLKHRNLQASTFLGWEVIKFGRNRGCSIFDMWGAGDGSYEGFTTFKLRFGGRLVKYIPSYDFVLDKSLYWFFTTANWIRWKILNNV